MNKLPIPIAFEWDKGNFDKNLIKHKITNKETEEIFKDRYLKIFTDTKHSKKEQRFVAYGTTNTDIKLTIVFTLRNKKIRVTSARNQNKKERRVYEKIKIDAKI